MPYYITKTGLDAFDTARAWGLAVLLNVLTEDEVRLQDAGWVFILEPTGCIPNNAQLTGLSWRTLFTTEDVQWRQVFVTAGDQRKQVREILEQQWQKALSHYNNSSNVVILRLGNQRQGQTIYGSLDPAGFKGLRSESKAAYKEPPVQVEGIHAALAYLGMATCGYYWENPEGKTFALLPIPSNACLSYYRETRSLLKPVEIRRRNRKFAAYHSIQNAAAHYAVQLAEQLRRRAAAQGSLRDRYSAVLYFKLFGAGQQMKPAQGNQLRLEPLMDAIARDPHGTQPMLEWLDYCFRLGATEGAEDLALATTELVMRWDLGAYDRLIRVAVRILGHEQVRRKNPRDFASFLRRTQTEAIQQTMEVMPHAVV